jgi:hypothetical protein
MDDVASTMRLRSSCVTTGWDASTSTFDVIAAGVQGAMPLQFTFVHGSWHGGGRSAGE